MANAWRPAHVHFSIFGAGLLRPSSKQMLFPGAPLLAYDPIYNMHTDEKAKQGLISMFIGRIRLPSLRWGIDRYCFARTRRTPVEK